MEQKKWYSVKSGMMPTNIIDECIVHLVSGVVAIAVHENGKFFVLNNSGRKVNATKYVTHWMNLPYPPKHEE